MHMAPRAAAWVAWAVWTCNTPHRVTVEESGLLARFFFGMGVVGNAVRCSSDGCSALLAFKRWSHLN
jgi:hypothetical protein